MQIQNFDATNITPQQVMGKHPEGMFPFQITNTSIVPTKDNTGGRFLVEFTTAAGTISNGYNLFNQSQKAVEIAQKELSALCHAVGVFKLSMNADNMAMAGSELRGARGIIKVAAQANNPDYNEVKMVYDSNGNEPGKGGAAPAPQTQQGGSWGAPATGQAPAQNNAPPANSGGGWGQPGGMQQQPAAQQQAPAGNGGAAKPPWAS